MEYALEGLAPIMIDPEYILVLILVLMEYALEAVRSCAQSLGCSVLILVLMEYALEEVGRAGL